jgi:hypothetical protein
MAHPPVIEIHRRHLEPAIVITRSVGFAFVRKNMAVCRKRPRRRAAGRDALKYQDFLRRAPAVN